MAVLVPLSPSSTLCNQSSKLRDCLLEQLQFHTSSPLSSDWLVYVHVTYKRGVITARVTQRSRKPNSKDSQRELSLNLALSLFRCIQQPCGYNVTGKLQDPKDLTRPKTVKVICIILYSSEASLL